MQSGSAVVALLCAALGVGAAAAVFTSFYAVALAPLPYEDPERLVTIWEVEEETKHLLPLSAQTFLDTAEASETFAGLAAWNLRDVLLTGEGQAEKVSAAAVTSGFFTEVLRVKASLGRTSLEPEEPATVVLGHGFWRRRFGADPAVVGRRLTLDGELCEVIGVLDEGFVFENPEAELMKRIDLWRPLDVEAFLRYGRGTRFLRVLGRLREGVSSAAAQSELETIDRRIAAGSPESNAGYGLRAVPLLEKLVGHVRSELWVLFGGGVLVFLVACGSVTGFLLVRVVERRRELAVRAALGASWWRLGGEAGRELLVLWLAAGALAALPAVWTVDALAAASPVDVPRLGDGGLGLEASLFAFGFAFLAALVCLPAVAGATLRAVSFAALRGGVSGSSARGRLRSLLVVAELALAVALVATGGLLAKSLWRLAHVELGFRPEGVLTARLDLPRSRYGESHQSLAFYDQLVRRLEALPEVEGAGLAMALPLSGVEVSTPVTAETAERPWRGEEVAVRVVSPGYFAALGIRFADGRAFEADDAAGALVVNQAFAREVWRGGAPRGRVSVDWFGMTEVSGPVTGIADDVRFGGLDEVREPAVYVPVDRLPSRGLSLAVKTTGDPEALYPVLLSIVSDLDSELAVDALEPMSAKIARTTARQRFVAGLGLAFAGLAIVLSVVGLYGTTAYAVSQRTREVGLRMALGADRPRVLFEVVASGLVLIGTALVLGVAAALAGGRLVAGLLYELRPTDPGTLAAAAATVAAVALAGVLVPAARAARLDPARCLRYE